MIFTAHSPGFREYGIWESGSLGYDSLGVWRSGSLGPWESGSLDVRESGSLRVWESGSLGVWKSGCCCLLTSLTLASRLFPLEVHQLATPSIWLVVQSLQRGLSTSPRLTTWCIYAVEEMMCVVCGGVTEGA